MCEGDQIIWGEVRPGGNVRADALTPAHSHREREKTDANISNVHKQSPLPVGEGQGEGKKLRR